MFQYMQDEDVHIENIKQSRITAEKKVASGLISQNTSRTTDKKQKKYPGFVIGFELEKSAKLLDESKPNSVLADVLKQCSDYCIDSSRIQAENEENIERVFLDKIREYTTEVLPKLTESKERVQKDYSQLKSARSKYEASLKALNNSSTGPSSIAENKTENLKTELEECEQKHKTSRDQYEAEMMIFSGEEIKIAQLFSDYIQVQKVYFDEMQERINEILPKIDNVISSSSQRPVFGTSLSEHLRASDRKISLVVEFGIGILRDAKDEEGLFRLSGSSSKIKALRNALDARRHEEVMRCHSLKYEYHVVAGVIKAYRRDLPEPLLTKSLADEWLRVAK